LRDGERSGIVAAGWAREARFDGVHGKAIHPMWKLSIGVLASWILVIAGCASAPKSAEDQATLNTKCEAAIASFTKKDPSLKKHFETAAGWAVFPTIGKGGMGVGGAWGSGQVYGREKGLMGYTTLSQATIGFQLGGQAYSELILFEDVAALDRFIGGNFEFSAQVSAVAATAGASADANYSGGVMVLTIAGGGLMYEASVGGQKFDYKAK